MATYDRLNLSTIKTNMKKHTFLPSVMHKVKRTPLLVAMALVVASGTTVSIVHGASCTTITDCQNQIATDKNALAGLQGQAASYQDAIAKLNAQIASIEQQIAINQAHQADLQAQIVAAQAKLDEQKLMLGNTLKAMYVAGQMSTVEMLATSKNL